MEKVFLEILNRGITAGWLVLAVLVLRLVFRRAPKKFFVVLWAFVGLRLVIPFSLESTLSLIPSAETVPQEALTAESPAIQSGIRPIDNAVNPVISRTLQPGSAGHAKPLQNLAAIAGIIWAAGAGIMLLYAFISWLRIRLRVRAAVHMEDRIWACDYIDTPFILGVLRPRFFLPSSLSGEDREAVIAHEKAHLARRDHLWKPLGFLLLSVFWFHPLLWAAYIMLCRDIEYACDEKVLAGLDRSGQKNYAEALLNVSVPRRMIIASPLAFGETGVKGRIKNVLRYKKATVGIAAAAVILLAVVALCFLTNPRKMQIVIAKEDVDRVEYHRHDYNSTYQVARSSEAEMVDSLIDEVNGDYTYAGKNWSFKNWFKSGGGADSLRFYSADGTQIQEISFLSTGYVLEPAFLGEREYRSEKGILNIERIEACFPDMPWNQLSEEEKLERMLSRCVYDQCSRLYELAEYSCYRTVEKDTYDTIQGYLVEKVIQARGLYAAQSNAPGIRRVDVVNYENRSRQPETGTPETVDLDIRCRVEYEMGGGIAEWNDRLRFCLERDGDRLYVKDIIPVLGDDYMLVMDTLRGASGFSFDRKPLEGDYSAVDSTVETLLIKNREAERLPQPLQDVPESKADGQEHPESGKAGQDEKAVIRQLIYEYAEAVFNTVNGSSTVTFSPEDFETANAYLAAKYYETLRERYAESGYPVLDHRITWVVLNRYFALENDQGRDLIFAEASISCAYTEPGMETPQEYTRNAELILEKTGEAQFKVLGFNSIGAAWELQDAVNKSGMSPEEKIRYIDAHIRDAALNDGLLPMSNK